MLKMQTPTSVGIVGDGGTQGRGRSSLGRAASIL